MIVVTGGAGFIGSAYVWYLNKMGYDNIIIVDRLSTSDKWKNLRNKKFEDYIHKDDFIKLLKENKLPKIEYIIHMGACSSTTEFNADYMMKNNYEYSKELAKYSVKNRIRFIYASSGATYGAGEFGFSDADEITLKLKPLNIYGFSKHLFDLWILKHNLNRKVVGLKFFNVFGPNEYHKQDMMSVVCKAFSQIKNTGKLKLFKSHKDGIEDGEQKRDFVYIKDVIRVIHFFFENKEKNGIYNVGSGKARSFNDLARAVFNAMEKPFNVEYITMPVEIQDKYQYWTEADLTKLRKIGYKEEFTELEDAVSDYVKNYLMKNDYL
jgi:ADP-L-glycero-D-manno-heptose 6-epimerase